MTASGSDPKVIVALSLAGLVLGALIGGSWNPPGDFPDAPPPRIHH